MSIDPSPLCRPLFQHTIPIKTASPIIVGVESLPFRERNTHIYHRFGCRTAAQSTELVPAPEARKFHPHAASAASAAAVAVEIDARGHSTKAREGGVVIMHGRGRKKRVQKGKMMMF